MNRPKDFFFKVAELIKKALNPNGNFSVIHSLILILLLSLWLIVFQSVAQGVNQSQLYWRVLAGNIIPILLLMSFLYFVTGKVSVSYVITHVMLAVLLAINYYKVKFRDEPLNFSDFSLGKEANNIVQNYEITLDKPIIFIIIACIISFALVVIFIHNKRPGLWASIIGAITCVALAVVANSLLYKNNTLYQNAYPGAEAFHESIIVKQKGLVYSLLNSANISEHPKPESYSQTNVNKILNQYPEVDLPTDAPNVIAVMSEAFTDIQKWENVEFSGKNPYEYYNYLKETGCYGELFVPQIGGGTAITEFEFLTGNNTSSINSSMPTAYKTLINSDVYSIVRIFKEMGYNANAIHLGDPWFYNRQNVYPRLGFDSFISKEDMPSDTPHKGAFIMDSVSADTIIKDYSKHLKENPKSGYFNFTVTIQNHGPYYENELFYDREYISKSVGLTDEQYCIINNYLGGIEDSDNLLKKLHEYINSLKEPTVLIFFGDHLPYLDVDEQIFDILGLDIKSDSYQAYKNRYSTDYLIIGNDAYLKDNQPSINGDQGIISSNYLAIKLFRYMNMELPPFHKLSEEMMQYAPILSRHHNGTTAGYEEETSEEFKKLFEEYKILQYYNLNDYVVKEGENQ